jgi:small GTP-binding protein
LHIAIFGRRNAGKSSLINTVTSQQAAIVSEVAGTTTDPVRKSMEILPIGPVVIIDTAGIDDTGALGEARVARTLRVLDQTDLASRVGQPCRSLRTTWWRIRKRSVPLVAVVNKIDVHPDDARWSRAARSCGASVVPTGERPGQLKQTMIQHAGGWQELTILSDLVRPRRYRRACIIDMRRGGGSSFRRSCIATPRPWRFAVIVKERSWPRWRIWRRRNGWW